MFFSVLCACYVPFRNLAYGSTADSSNKDSLPLRPNILCYTITCSCPTICRIILQLWIGVHRSSSTYWNSRCRSSGCNRRRSSSSSNNRRSRKYLLCCLSWGQRFFRYCSGLKTTYLKLRNIFIYISR